MKNEAFLWFLQHLVDLPLGFVHSDKVTWQRRCMSHFRLPSGFAVATKSGSTAALEEAVDEVSFTRNC